MPDLGLDRRAMRLLLVDPDDRRRALLAEFLSHDGYGAVLECADVPAACGNLERQSIDLVLLDLDGPEIGSGAVAALMFSVGSEDRVPVVGFTADASAGGRAHAARTGVVDFAIYPIGADELRLRVENALSGGRLRRLRDSVGAVGADGNHSDPETIRDSLSVLAAIADYHDDDGDLHAQRVGALSAAIATLLELPASFVAMLRAVAPLHDIGKVGISRRILLKQDKLTPSEWLHMMSHVDVGAQILGSARSELFVLAAEIARTHHERWDGSGYTDGLRGEEIPMSGRIVAVADVWDTLTHDRPYRPALEHDRALSEIRGLAGTHFDPRVVAAFETLDGTMLSTAGARQTAVA